MLIYLIPLVILIVVLIVFKKRQDAQGSAKPKKAVTSSKAPSKTVAVAEPVVTKKEATPLSHELRKKIETLIGEANYFSAEAQINQALNRDNSQHELYLLLLDIHTKQKDEFAISQLINHIRSLGLDEILEQAEAKKAEYDKSAHLTKDTIDYDGTVENKTTNHDAFAELEEPHVADDTAFEALQAEIKPTKSVFEAKPTQNDIQPLEFNFEPSLAKTETPAESEKAPEAITHPNELSFDLSSSTAEATTSIPSLEFNLDSTLAAESVTANAEDIKPLDFSFSIDSSTDKVPNEVPVALNSDLNSAPTSLAAEPLVESTEFDFKLDSVDEKVESARTGVSFDVPATPVPSTDANDPLVQSFPELQETDEITVNLSLAEQYIKLGAYDAARELLAEKEAQYSAEQRQQADQLLNQIAS